VSDVSRSKLEEAIRLEPLAVAFAVVVCKCKCALPTSAAEPEAAVLTAPAAPTYFCVVTSVKKEHVVEHWSLKSRGASKVLTVGDAVIMIRYRGKRSDGGGGPTGSFRIGVGTREPDTNGYKLRLELLVAPPVNRRIGPQIRSQS
jgi:hypothetical protein